jgi:type I restriction enzyme S subunit
LTTHIARRKVREFAEVTTGGTPSTVRPEFWDGGTIPWLRSGELRDCKIFSSEKFITDVGLRGSVARLMPAKTVLIALTGATTGQTGILEFEASANQSVTGILPSAHHHPEYLFYYLRSIKGDVKSKTYGAAQPHISQDFVKNIEVPLPSLPIQKRIAAILEKADAAWEKRRQAYQLTEQFLQSAFLEMFGDPVTNPKGWETGSLGEAIQYSEYGTSQKSNDEKRGCPIIGMGNVTYEGQLNLTGLKYVALADEEFKKLRLQRGDIIFNRTNSTELVGKTAYWNVEMDAVIASYLVKLRLTSAFNPTWFSALLNTGYYKKLFMQRCRKAVGQSNISPTLLREFPMYKPPMIEQQKFAALVEKVEALRDKQRQSEQELENLFNSLMQRAFRGGL